MGTHFLNAARSIELECLLIDTREAFESPYLWAKVNWHLRGRRPGRIASFGRRVLEEVDRFDPDLILTTGFTPLLPPVLKEIQRRGLVILNYSTDDPFNPAHRAPWFMECLPLYDEILSTRRGNLVDLKNAGAQEVRYLPFAYAPEVHYPQAPEENEVERLSCDSVFIGGSDKDRLPFMRALIEAGFIVHLYGNYWEKDRVTRGSARGIVGTTETRKAIFASTSVPCLVRRANRDGTSMRSFEVPAMLGCPLFEKTDDHLQIFGEEGDSALYFSNPDELVSKVRVLVEDSGLRDHLRRQAHKVVTTSGHRYSDRLVEAVGKHGDTPPA